MYGERNTLFRTGDLAYIKKYKLLLGKHLTPSCNMDFYEDGYFIVLNFKGVTINGGA